MTDGQLELLRTATRGRKPKPPEGLAEELPVARVLVDVPLPHLDRPFDYAVPASMADGAQPGARVRVRFAGQEVDGFVLERAAQSEHDGRLARLGRLVSPERVLTPAVAALARAVADRYAGTLIDVTRLAVPPRHARVEKEPVPDADPLPPLAPGESTHWGRYPAGPALLHRIAEGDPVRAVWTAMPGAGHWTAAVAEAMAAAVAAGRGALAVVPDARDVAALDAALTARWGSGRHVALTADLGPAARYRAFLKLARGHVQAVIGTRATAFAPVRDLGLVLIWDDGDDSHAEPRSPYPHAREVLALRSQLEGAALICGSWSRTAEAQAWVDAGWARPVQADRSTVRAAWPHVTVAGTEPGGADDPSARGRLPAAVWRAVRAGLAEGPVLVQVPRAGYVPTLACQQCRTPARCAHCHGPLGAGLTTRDAPACRWCGRDATGWACPACGGRRVRAVTVGVHRTAEELGRGFPGVPVVVPAPGQPAPDVPQQALVVSTPGLEPAPPGAGYAAAALLDAHQLLERLDLRAAEDALRRWLAAAALVRPRDQGGRVVIAADPQSPPVQALVRLDPAWHAARDLAERAELGFPPAAAMVSLTGPGAAVQGFADLARLPEGADRLGPIPLEDAQGPTGDVRLLLRAARADRAALARAVAQAASVRSARREVAVRVQVDPDRIG
ncbi:primosome assembly protein PriA [Spongisporangium articulatum]|uniref:Probable replication restart protein PriA n=1 Tax=Spongisporangium articulatum TaxID=3362603 RepID=A0ABW8ARA6_9ACTN